MALPLVGNAATTAALNSLPPGAPRLPGQGFPALQGLAGQGTVGNAAVASGAVAAPRGPVAPGTKQPRVGAARAAGTRPVAVKAKTPPATAPDAQERGRADTSTEQRPEKTKGKTEAGGHRSPGADPKFQALKKDVAAKKRMVGTSHPPARTEATAAQEAAVPPADDQEARGKAAHAEDMDAAQPKEFNKDAFVAAVEKAIADRAPKNLDEADKFGDSGKAEEVKQEVQGKVGEGRESAAQEIADTTAQPPQPAPDAKPVVPLKSDRPPGKPAGPNANHAVPDTLPASATDMSAGPEQVNRQMADAKVTEKQLARSNEPTFKAALASKKTMDKHSATAPRALRGAEAEENKSVRNNAAVVGPAAMTSMAGTRVDTGRQVTAGKGRAKGSDEEKRVTVTALLQQVFDKTKADVEKILSDLDATVDTEFTRGEKRARDQFTREHEQGMEEYKDRRYSGWAGKARWVKDLFADLPEEANRVYERAKANYLTAMRQVITDIAGTVERELRRAKDRIADGRKELRSAVDKLPKDLQAIGRQAAGEFADKFDELRDTVNDKGTELVDTLATKYTDAVKEVDKEIAAEKEKNKGLVNKAKDAIAGAIQAINELKNLLMGVLRKAVQAIGMILTDPIGFLGKLVSAVGGGLELFKKNVGKHMQQGVLTWLLGVGSSAGVQIPAKFDIRGILLMIASLLGISWQNIRSRLVRKVPEQAVSAAETAVPLVSAVKRQGVAGAWDDLRSRVGDLKKDLVDRLIKYLTPTVVLAGITWILSLLNPASAFVRACKMIIDIVRFIVTQARQIIEFVNSVLDAVIAIARGGTGGVPAMIERALARSIPVLIGALAAILGIGGIAGKVRQIFQQLAAPVNRAVDWVIDKIVGLVKKLWAKIKPRKKPAAKPARRGPDRKRPGRRRPDRSRKRRKDKRPRRGAKPDRKRKRPEKRSKKDMQRALDAAVRDATRLLDAEGATEESVRRGLPAIKTRHRLNQILLEQAAPGRYFITVAINPKKRTSYRDIFPYKIGKARKPISIERHPHAVVQLHAITQPMDMERNDRWIGFVVNMAAIPDEIRKNPTVALRYLDKAWEGTGAKHAQDLAEARTAVVIGINTFERLNPQGDNSITGAINSVGRRPELRMAVFGFVWTPRWVNVKTDAPVGIDAVRASYQRLNSRNKRRAEANEKGLRDKDALPYGLFREEVMRSEHTRAAVEILKAVNRQVHIVSQDADTGAAAISGVGVLRAYEKVLSEMDRHPLLTIGGYHFEDFDWGRKADPRAKQLTLLANRLDRAIRVAIAEKYPQMLYPTEPNMLIKAWDKDHSGGIFQNARTRALLEAGDNARNQGKLFGVGGAEGRNFRNQLMKIFGTDFAVVYAPEASTSTSPLPRDLTRGLTVRAESVRRAAKGRMRGKRWEEAIRVSHRMYALIIQSQSNASAHTLAREFYRATRGLSQEVRDELQTKIFVHVEDVAMLMADNPKLTYDSPAVSRHLRKLESNVETMVTSDAAQNERYKQAIERAHETTKEIISAMTAPELTGLWHRIQRELDAVTKPRKRGGRG
ncbi:hypothetical protein ACIOJD_14770 [Streptomyces sp. NPDC088116]|uniref:hypothetical protein n=1 Tax=Streptomyces sp. NPDC088116 TaxID=3365825 RepID=UPI00381A994A